MRKGFKNEMAQERCKHGMVKSWCGICQNYRPAITKIETKTSKNSEWWKQPKKYPGILNQAYQMCGVRQCSDNSNYVRCSQPVYGENETLCYYHQKIEDRKAKQKFIGAWNSRIKGGFKDGKKNEQHGKRMCEQTKRSYRNRKLHHYLIQDVATGRTTFVDESLTDIVNKYGQTTYLKNEHIIGEDKIIKISIQ